MSAVIYIAIGAVVGSLVPHFVTLWMIDLPSGYGGRLGGLGWP
ncbi:MAG TPA: hypothetical protein VFX61_01850 [Micromonosporaceae bacterium]|nr:hypothetical protein [Micromonosporaceae bacterium]